MKALTVCQPYADLITLPPHTKRVENRAWRTDYRGWLGIHAGRNRSWLTGKDEVQRRFGFLVGAARLVACVHIDEVETWIADQRRTASEDFEWLRDHPHASGPWCWILPEALRLQEPIPMHGKRMLWELPAAIEQIVTAAIAARTRRATNSEI